MQTRHINVAMLLACCVANSVWAADSSADRHSVRFHTPSGSPMSYKTMAFSPDGGRLAVVIGDRIQILDTLTRRVLYQRRATPFVVRYTRDGRGIYYVSSSEHKLLSADLSREIPLQATPAKGYVGMSYEPRDGRLIITNVLEGGPIAKLKSVRKGDQLVTIGEGRGGRMDTLSGYSNSATRRLKGPVGSWLRIGVIHSGETEAKTYALQRMAAAVRGGTLVFHDQSPADIGDPLVWCMRDGRHNFDSTETGKTVATLTTVDIHNVGVQALSSDGRLFAVLARMNDGNGDAAEVFDVATGDRVAYIPYLAESYQAIRFSADGKNVLCAARKTIEILNVDQQQATGRFSLDTTPKAMRNENTHNWGFPSSHRVASCLAVSPAGTIATGSTAGVVRLWSGDDGALLRTIRDGQEKKILDLRFSADGGTLAWVSNGVVSWLDLRGRRESSTPVALAEPRLGGFERKQAVAAPTTRTPEPADSSRLIRTFMTHPVHEGYRDRLETFVEFAPDGNTLYLGGSWGVIPPRPVPPKVEKKTRRRGGIANIMTSVADSIADGASGPADPQRLPGGPSPYPVGGKFRSLNGKHGKMPGTVDAYRVSDGRWLRTFECRRDEDDRELDTCKAADLSPDGRLLAVLGGKQGYPGELHVFEAPTGKLLFEREVYIDGQYHDFQEIAFLADSRRFLTRDTDGDDKLVLHAALDGRFLDAIATEDDDSYVGRSGLRTSADGRRFSFGATVVDAHTAEVVFTPDDVKSWFQSLCLSPDGTTVFGYADRTQPRLVHNGRAADFGPKRANEDIMSSAFSPDGRLLAITSAKHVEIWDVELRIRRETISGHLRAVDLVTFSPDGRMLATVARDGATRLWDVSDLTGGDKLELIDPPKTAMFQLLTM